MMMFQKNARYVFTMKINKDMIIGECLAKYPQTAKVLFDHGIHCVGCFAANMETLEDGLQRHGLSEEEVNKIIKELNDSIDEE